MNVVWIVIDCLRRDRLGIAGSRRLTTPHLDRLVPQGVWFDQCISPHIPTHPAHTTFFTGRDVFAHQIVAQGGRRSSIRRSACCRTCCADQASLPQPLTTSAAGSSPRSTATMNTPAGTTMAASHGETASRSPGEHSVC